jgi:hypothetical protein
MSAAVNDWDSSGRCRSAAVAVADLVDALEWAGREVNVSSTFQVKCAGCVLSTCA